MLRLHLLSPLLILLACLPTAISLVSKGSFDTLASWTFVDRFCFIPHALADDATSEEIDKLAELGLFQYTVRFPKELDLTLSVFYERDLWDSWDLGWKAVNKKDGDDDSLSCSDRYAHAAAKFRLQGMPSAHLISSAGVNDMEVSGYAYFKASNPKFFFVSLSNCAEECTCDYVSNPDCEPPMQSSFCSGPIVADYTMSFTNGKSLNKEHFGYDEVGILPTSIVFLAVYTLLTLLITATVKKPLQALDKYHLTVQIVVLSVWCMWTSLCASVFHYQTYAGDGIGLAYVLQLGRLAMSAAEWLLVVHFILIAKGWTIVRRKISANGRVKIAIFSTLYLLLHLATRWYSAAMIDRSRVTYEYETPPGIALQYSRLFAACWFAHACYTTMKDFPNNKRHFYKKYSVVFGLWFVWMVLSIWIAAGIPDYLRAKFSFAIETSLIFTAHFILGIMYNPNLETVSSFPFHSNAAHEVMTGRFNSEEYSKELRRPNRARRRRGESKDRNFAFEPSVASMIGGVPVEQPSSGGGGPPYTVSSSGFNNDGAPGAFPATPSGSPPLLQQAQLAPQPEPQQHFAFGSVEDAMEAVRITGDDVSEILHSVTAQLDTLDDAMDDWDDNLADERGEEYDDLLDEHGGGLPLHHSTGLMRERRANSRRGDR
ncbi:hypothetical protein TeGR_g4172 [Tetraparma gracilis]|uniref:GPR180/TMEM145 transmembrane domain-containing protein n=1 Tax=Tetraparma gracilis TaxID=2962635 RepID=A0ABQ6MPX0_9STRA|nr:hypothetical protein TeGR_g4172 [Tetraparma gracilis]